MSQIRRLFLAWDFLASASCALTTWCLLPAPVPSSLARDLYNMGVTVSSIVFSVFFTALAVVMTSGDDAFVKFLRQQNLYSEIMWSFEVTLLLLFCGLVASILGYSVTSVLLEIDSSSTQPALVLSSFAMLFTWGLLAAIRSANDAITYAKKRGEYMDIVES